jgi:hypothetical protein
MIAPRPMSIVVEGLPTTSAKIRALAAEGYLRADIARFLGIAYQHVRKVLEDAGSREGLQRDVAPSTAPKSAPAAEPLTVDVLVAAGFTLLGTWTAGDDGIELEVPAPKRPGVYAFAINGTVQYVGVTQGTFHQRMYQYRRGDPGQTTNARINPVIAAELAAGRIVEIYLAMPDPAIWNGLPVNMAAGLEEGLIKRYSLPWNVRGARG